MTRNAMVGRVGIDSIFLMIAETVFLLKPAAPPTLRNVSLKTIFQINRARTPAICRAGIFTDVHDKTLLFRRT
tara:strand:+ start:421 stop:639 length:219 start_codon:yes stop_codon:yes gene_type:complete